MKIYDIAAVVMVVGIVSFVFLLTYFKETEGYNMNRQNLRNLWIFIIVLVVMALIVIYQA